MLIIKQYKQIHLRLNTTKRQRNSYKRRQKMLKKLKNTDKDILPFIKNVGLLSLGIIWCFYILYIRVFITRIPYTLESLYERFGTYLLYTFVFGITIRIF